ncbi:MAG TPA: phosphatase PAP2 family protein [Candidatus Acidoferrales bacterium]|nr:phosphatase PAP2 family protein [Candidatus Acidoferrales bacterium]
MTLSRRLAAAAYALLAACATFALGRAVGRAPDPSWLMGPQASWVNHATAVAWAVTQLGYFYLMLPVTIALALLAVVFRAWRSRLIFAVLEILLAWRSTDLLQRFFARPRRLDWVVKHETSFSYPSSHAAVAATLYLLLAVFVVRSALPGRAWIASALGLLSLAILWSRLALGAHYLTDVAGGLLWGSAVTAALAACWPTNVFEGRAAPSLE